MIAPISALLLWVAPSAIPPSAPSMAPQQDPLPALPDAQKRFRKVEAEFAQGLIQRRPWLARERGVAEIPLDLGRYGSTGAAWWKALLQRIKHDLIGVHATTLSPLERARYDSILARVQGEDLLQRTFHPARWDPVAYIERLERMIVGAELGEDPERELEAVLSVVPELWENAKRGLVSPKKEWIDDARERLERVQKYLNARTDPPKNGELQRDELDQTSANAAEATLAFAAWLSHGERGSEPMTHAGASNWEVLIAAIHGRRVTPARLKVLVLREIARLDLELGARQLVPAEPDTLTSGPLLTRLDLELVRADSLAQGLQLFADLPAGFPELTMFIRVDSAPTDPIVRLRTQPTGHLLELAVRGIGWPPYAQRTRYALLDAPGVRALAIRYGPLGEALARSIAATSKPNNPILWNPALLDGFGLYALDWACRLDVPGNPFAADDELHAASVRIRLIAAARLLASLELHAEQLPDEEVILAFARRTGLDYQTAELEVLKASHDPFLGIGYLGYMDLRTIEAGFAEDLGPADAIRRTVLTTAKHLCTRPSDLERRAH